MSKEDLLRGKIKQINDGPDYRTCNTVVNTYLEYTEVVYYKKSFTIREGENPLYVDLETGELLERKIDRAPLLLFNDDGSCIIKDGRTLSDVLSSGKKSDTRALANFYGYALSNFWRYFLTVTIDSKYDRKNDKLVKGLWSKFSHNFSRRFPGVKILCRPERHKTGELHFHCLIGNCDLSQHLTKYFDPVTFERKVSNSGAPLFTLNIYNYGFSTVAVIPEDNQTSIVANYLVKYLLKEREDPLRDRFQKRFYHTRNLDFKNKNLLNMSSEDLDKLENECYKNLYTVKYKDNAGMTVYRIYNDLDYVNNQRVFNYIETKEKKQ